MRNLGKLLCILGISPFSGLNISAQQITASIRGTVVDASGGAVSSATVTATQSETNFTRTAVSDAQGNFIFIELPVGHYGLQAEAKGFQKFLQEGITLEVNQTAFVSVHLAIGIITQQIDVLADLSLIERSATNLGQRRGEREG